MEKSPVLRRCSASRPARWSSTSTTDKYHWLTFGRTSATCTSSSRARGPGPRERDDWPSGP